MGILRNCPSCQKEFEISEQEVDIRISRRLSCPHCLTMFEVTWLFPLTLDFVEENSVNQSHSIENLVN